MRLINADELKAAFPCGERVTTEYVRATIDHAPAIELVRCGECMYRDKGEYEYCPLLLRKTFEGFYCALGDREADNET